MNWKKRAASLLIAGGILLLPQAALAVDAGVFEFAAGEKEIDPGGSITNAAKITIGNTYQGTISDVNTRDFYSFELPRTMEITLNLTAHIERVKYTLYNSKGNQLSSWAPTWDSAIHMSILNKEQNLTAGTYYLAVEQYYTPMYAYSGDYSFQVSAGASQEFYDIMPDAYYAKAVQWTLENEITCGITETTFGPDKECSRGEIVTMLWRAAGSPEPSDTAISFQDVKPSQYFYKPVLWAIEKGITSGTTKTTFSPNTTCTRGQAMTFLWTAQGKPTTLNAVKFKDVGEDSYCYSAVRWAVKNNITSGTSPTTFSPNAKCTRAQIAVFLYQAMA